MPIRVQRVYENPERGNGPRILVDRFWPRGLAKAKARIDFWARAIAPSDELRRWYGHDPEKWDEFKTRYFVELDRNPEGVEELRQKIGDGAATLLFSSKEEEMNNAVALKVYLEERV